MDYEIVKKTGIGVGVFAKLVGVSRVTASAWINGKAKPHELRQQQVGELLGKLARLHARGLLPLPKTRSERSALIRELLADAN